ncbi:permease family protein [Streptococcus pyogenes]|nr:permease family protein [Streptococcus pyogenes]
MTIRTFNGTSIRSSEAFYNQFSMVPDVISSYSKEHTVKTANIATYIFITFLSILLLFVQVVFCTLQASSKSWKIKKNMAI